jgi:two-component system phosphate regulon sensor histidine kinase PhoR
VDDVVDFSKIQQGERPYRLVSAPISDVVRRAAARFASYARVRGLSLNAEIGDELGPLNLDPRAVEQAVLNLLDNAAKYAGDSTEIDLRVRTSGAQVLVEVRDRGIGIPAAEQAHIFNRFHRGTHVDRGGYGLGLYLVRHIMEAHGGRVEVASASGEGSVFTLHFPHRAPEGGDAKSTTG